MSFPAVAKTYREQIELLRGRGLQIDDEAFATECLAHCNYYRLSIYRMPFVLSGNLDKFVTGTRFEDVWGLYVFDRNLRNLVIQATKMIEISVRSQWAYVLGHKYGAQAYELATVFRDNAVHERILSSFDKEIKKREKAEFFIQHYVNKYKTRRPPIWVVCEVMTFGCTSNVLEKIAKGADRQEIANRYDMPEQILCSILHHLTEVRNMCAHHGRLWDRLFQFRFIIPTNHPMSLVRTLETSPANNKVYNTLSVLIYLTDKIDKQSNFRDKISALMSGFKKNLYEEMGFPDDWATRELWESRPPAIANQTKTAL